MDNISNTSEESNISMSSGVDVPEDPVNEPVHIDKKHFKGLDKIILERGEGYDKPGTIDRVVAHIAQSHEEDLPEAKEYVLGQGQLPIGLEKAIVSMRKDEVCQVFVPAQFANGQEATFKVKLLSWVNIHDLHADGALIKTVLAKGFGYERVEYKDEVTLNVKITDGDAVLYEQNDWHSFVEADKFSNGLMDILKSMKIHEHGQVEVNKEYFAQHFSFGSPTNKPVVEIKVLDMKKAEDVTHDGTFYKRIVNKGEGKDIPNSNARLKIRYKIEGGDTVFLSNFGEEPFECILDDEQVPTLWSTCLRQMREGDLIKVECNLLGLSSGDLSDGLNPSFCLEQYPVQNLTSVELYLELVSFEMGKVSYHLTMPERAEEANRIKEVATIFFRKKEFGRAKKKYEAANVCLEPINDDPQLFRPIHYTLMANISLCYLKMENFHKAEEYANKVIEHNPADVKALLRRGIARRELSNYEGALHDFKQAEASCQCDQREVAMVKQELTVLHKLIAQYKNKEKNMYTKMFK